MDFSNIYITTFIKSVPVHREQLEVAFKEGREASQLANFIDFCCESSKNIGDQSFFHLTGKTVAQVNKKLPGREINPDRRLIEVLSDNFICFDWAEAAKSFTILLRDVLVQHQKATILAKEESIASEEVVELQKKSLSVIDEAITFLEGYFENFFVNKYSDEKSQKRALESYELKDNPWPVFQKQFDQIELQAKELKATGDRLFEIADSFENIRQHILNTPNECKKEFEQYVEKAKYAAEFINNNMLEKPGKVASYLEDLESEIKLPHHLEGFTESIKDQLDKIGDKLLLPFDLKAGIIQQKEINFRDAISQWVDAEILPLLYEIWEHTEALEGNLKMSLINIRNRAIILEKEAQGGPVEKENYAQPLELYQSKARDWFDTMVELEKQVVHRMKTYFQLSRIYLSKESFLPIITMQSTLNNLDIRQNELIVFFRKQYTKLLGYFRRLQKNVEKEGNLSLSEKVVRAIESVSVNTADGQYASIFQTKGYIGESFWVGRAEQLSHMEGIIGMWKKGFRGGVALTGQRLSGKTLFGEKVANLYFPKNTIRISPNTMVRVQSKKFVSGYKLSDVLHFVRNNTINTKSLVWIDDLELWANEQVPLGQNVRALKEFMDNYSGHLFFMVSMSNWAKAHLNTIYNLQTSFQAEIPLDRMERSEVSKAIMIRHGATHKVLVDEVGNELTANLFREKVSKIYSSSGGVIGDALNRWLVATREIEGDKITHGAHSIFALPDFLNPDVGILLKTIMLQKMTTDYRLRKLFGPPFRSKYKSILQRLISLKIVVRNIDNTLEVNENIANDLSRHLDRKKYLGV